MTIEADHINFLFVFFRKMYFQPPENVNGEAELMICQEDSPEVKREKRETKESFKSLLRCVTSFGFW